MDWTTDEILGRHRVFRIGFPPPPFFGDFKDDATAAAVARELNRAFAAGQRDKAATIREVLGLD